MLALDIWQFFADMGFVIQIMTFSYLLFWLYLTFRDMPILFGISSLIGAYFIWINPISVTFLMILFFGLIFFGNQLQMIILFGIAPLFGLLTGKRMPQPGESAAMLEQEEVQQIEQKIMQGTEITAVEQKLYAGQMEKQMTLEQSRQNMARRRPMG